MKTKDFLTLLLDVFKSFDVHPAMIEELLKILAASGNEKNVLRMLAVRLKILRAYGAEAVKHEEFESIKNGHGLYSMHLAQSNFNLRILYAFLPNKMPCLLLCFYKRSKKSNTDYSKHIPLALERLKEKMEEYKNVQK